MKNVWWFLVSLTTLFWVNAEVAYCQSSANYQIEWSVSDGGGGKRSSASYNVVHSIGQPTGSILATNSKYANTSGVYAGPMRPKSSPSPTTPTPSPVPEPATLLLVGAGIVGIVAFARKRWQGANECNQIRLKV